MPTKAEKDALTGKVTTEHEWDGIRELNTPLPTWWLYILYATIAWALVMFVLYPAIPLGWTHTDGVLGVTTRTNLEAELKQLQAQRAPVMNKIAQLEPAEIRKNPDLLAVAEIAGRSAFANNCAPCHGPAGSGRIGYPNLADDVWIWGGTLEAIKQTITYGVRSSHPQARVSDMPHFGADGLLTAAQIEQVADYVWTLYGNPPGPGTAAGQALFADNCAMCHGEKGQGSQEMGAPPLAARAHLYGADRATIVRQVTLPHQGVMPAWTGRLDPATINSLTLYVHSLGGGQ
jgi:cytochrome c oxidase cbb3-type subunit 3